MPRRAAVKLRAKSRETEHGVLNRPQHPERLIEKGHLEQTGKKKKRNLPAEPNETT